MDDQRAGRPVVAGVDGSESALQAVRWAAREAARRRVPLRLVTVVAADALVQLDQPWNDLGPLEMMRQARGHLASSASAAAEATPGITTEQEVLDGSAIPRLMQESGSAQLVVVGDRGLGGVGGLLVGSVAFTLAAHGACPVVVVRGRTEATEGPVVVGVDRTLASEAALVFAFEAASARRAPLVAFRGWWDPLLDPMTLPSLDWEGLERRERAALAERLGGWREKFPDVEVELLAVRRRPARVLVEQSQQAQLVVVGSRGRGEVASLVLGSVSHAVLHRADCPVAVVRADDTTDGRR